MSLTQLILLVFSLCHIVSCVCLSLRSRLSNNQGMNIQIHGKTTILMITNVTEEDYGNYTCVASNRLGIQNASLFLYSEYITAIFILKNVLYIKKNYHIEWNTKIRALPLYTIWTNFCEIEGETQGLWSVNSINLLSHWIIENQQGGYLLTVCFAICGTAEQLEATESWRW